MSVIKGFKTVILSDSESELPILGLEQAMMLTDSTWQAVKLSDTEHMQVGRGDSEAAMDQDLPEPAGPQSKAKAKAKKRRMVKELGNHNESPEPPSDVGSPEVLLEGLHRTRAARQNLNNAVNNRAAPARRSLNNKALMKEALMAKPPKVTKPGEKKGVKREPEDDDDTEDELDNVEDVKTRARGRKRVPQLQDTDEEMEEAHSASNVNEKEQQKRKASQIETTDNEMEEAIIALIAESKATRRPRKKKVLKLRPSRDEDSEQEDEDFLPTEAYPDHEGRSTKEPRRSSRIDSANTTANALGTNRSPSKVMTSGMAWDHKKDLIAGILQNVDYNPYHAQVSRYDLRDLGLRTWFNQNYPGFTWNIYDTTVAHFSPATSIFDDFELFLHIAEFFSGQQVGAVKVTVPEDCIQPQDPADCVSNQRQSVRAHKTTITPYSESEHGSGAIYGIVPDGPDNVAPRLFVEAIEAEHRKLVQAWGLTKDTLSADIWKQCRLVDMRNEDMIVAPMGRLSRTKRLLAENICATDVLRKELGCSDPEFDNYYGNSLHRSSSTKIGVNTPAFDLCNAAWTAWGMQMTEIGAYRLVYIHKGAPRVWTVVEPSGFQRLEDLVARTLHLSGSDNVAEDRLVNFEPRCHQFVGHKRLSWTDDGIRTRTIEEPGRTLYFTSKKLNAEGIRFTRFVQYQGEMVVLFPFSYYQGYNVGPNVVESMAYTSSRWEVFPTAGLLRQCNRSCYHGKQPSLVDLSFAEPVSRAADGSTLPIEEALEYNRARFLC